MSREYDRRNFLRNAALLPLCAAAGGLGPAGSTASGQTPIKRSGGRQTETQPQRLFFRQAA